MAVELGGKNKTIYRTCSWTGPLERGGGDEGKWRCQERLSGVCLWDWVDVRIGKGQVVDSG